MPTSFQATKDYSKGLRPLGSRTATNLLTGDPGPRLFAPGTVSRSAAAVKLAHAVLAAGSQRAARESAQAKADEESYARRIAIARGEQALDPNYMSAGERARVGQADVRIGLERDRLNKEKTPAPYNPINLPEADASLLGLQAGPNDPRMVALRSSRVRASEVAKRQARRGAAGKELQAAQAGLREMDRLRLLHAEEVEAQARQQFTDLAGRFTAPKGVSPDSVRSYAAQLGLPKGFSSMKPIPDYHVENFVKQRRQAGLAAFDQQVASARAKYLKIINETAGILTEDGGSGLSPAMEAILNQLDEATGGEAPR